MSGKNRGLENEWERLIDGQKTSRKDFLEDQKTSGKTCRWLENEQERVFGELENEWERLLEVQKMSGKDFQRVRKRAGKTYRTLENEWETVLKGQKTS